MSRGLFLHTQCFIPWEKQAAFSNFSSSFSAQMDSDESTRWEKYAEQCNPSGDPSHSLEAGLAMPVQRIRDYPAMLMEIKLRGGVRAGVLAEKVGSKLAPAP